MGKMKKGKNRLCLLLAAVLLAGSFSVLPAKAGSSTIRINKNSYQEELDSTVWHDADGDIRTEQGTIVFPDSSTASTKLITKTDVVRIEQLDTMMKVNFDLKFSKLPEGETFAFGMGLSSLEATLGEEGNLEIGFTNQGGLKVRVSAYETADEPTVLMEEMSIGNVGSTVKVEAVLGSSGKLTLKINGSVVCDTEIPVSGEGSVGFLQSGSCGAVVSDLEIDLYKYDRPQNCDISEDFEDGDFNSNLFGSKMTRASSYENCYLAVEEYNGNQVLMFKNVGKGYIATKYQYSNFELTFDMPYLQREEETDAEGNVVTAKLTFFGVSFGSDVGGKDENVDFTGAADLLLFSGYDTMGWNSKRQGVKLTKHLYREPECTKIPTFRISVIDGVVTAQIKYTDEPDSAYETMISYTTDSTPTGYIALWAPSEIASTFALDNISIKNLDKDPKLTEVEKVSSKWTIPADYAYKPTEKVYRETEEQEEESKWYLPIILVAGVCVAAIGVTTGVTCVVKRRKGRCGA